MINRYSSRDQTRRPSLREDLLWSILPWILFLLWVPGTSFAQESAQERELILETINAVGAAVEATSPQRIEWTLQQAGFPSDFAPPEWKKWPPLRQLEFTYRSAEAAETGQGKALLRHLSRVLANDVSDAIRDEQSLTEFFPEKRSEALAAEPKSSFRFVELSAAASTTRLPSEIRTMVTAVARYSGTFPGGTTALLGRCCGLKPSQGYEILYQMRTLADALNKGLAEGRLPPSIRDRFLRLLKDLVRYNDAILPVVEAKLGADFARHIEQLARSEGGQSEKVLHERLRRIMKNKGPSCKCCLALSSLNS